MVQPNGTRVKGKIGSLTLQFIRVWRKTCAYLSAIRVRTLYQLNFVLYLAFKRPPARIMKHVPVRSSATQQSGSDASQTVLFDCDSVPKKCAHILKRRMTCSTRTRSRANARLCCFSCCDKGWFRGFLVGVQAPVWRLAKP